MLEGVLLEVVVRRADVGVVQAVAHEPQRVVVVPRGILRVDLDVHAKLACEVEEVLLLVPHDHSYVCDTCLLELANLALDEHLPVNAEKALWLLVGDGGKARGETGRHDDRIADLVGPQGLETVKREAPLLDETGVLCVMQDGIHRTKGEARRHAELSLGHPSFRFRKRDKHLEHAFRERHGTSDTLEPVC